MKMENVIENIQTYDKNIDKTTSYNELTNIIKSIYDDLQTLKNSKVNPLGKGNVGLNSVKLLSCKYNCSKSSKPFPTAFTFVIPFENKSKKPPPLAEILHFNSKPIKLKSVTLSTV